MKGIEKKELDLLFNAVLNLETADECHRFFSDLCTPSEIKSMAQRISVAAMLKQKYAYSEITEKTGASTATISRVSKCINNGKDGYNLIIERIGETNEQLL